MAEVRGMRIETLAAYANVGALLPAGYSAYGTWVLLHQPKSQMASGVFDVSSHTVVASLVIAVGLVALASIFNFVSSGRRRQDDLPGRGKGATDLFCAPRWEIINNHRYENRAIDVDGKSFRDCSFKNVTLSFHGTAPTEFIGDSLFENVILSTDHAPTLFWRTIEYLFSSVPGAKLDTSFVDASGHKVERKLTASLVESPNVRQSEALRTLPVYLQDLRFELLALIGGTTLDVTRTMFFLKLSLCSETDTGLRDMNVTLTIGDRNYNCKPLDDLSQWILRTPFNDSRLPYKSFEEQPLNDASLWRDVQRNGLKSGLVKIGWVGVHVSDISLIAKPTKCRVEVTKPQLREPYKFRFSEWAESEETIYDVDFRKS
jgi:hypothetical protein